MEIDIKVNGKMTNNTVQDCSIMLKQIKKLQKNGEMEQDGHGKKLQSLQIKVYLNKEKDG